MKKYFSNPDNNKINILLCIVLSSILVVSSCKKERDFIQRADGPPTIERVRLANPTTADSSLTKAGLGSTIVIVGTNLANAQTVSFNGYKVVVNPAYATDKYLMVTISDSVPTLATNPNVPNEIKVTTPLGEAVYNFQVLPPPPVIDRISNEYAVTGASITLYGKYYFFIDTVVFPGNIAVTSGFTTSTDGGALTVTVPPGVNFTAADLNMHVKSQSGWSGVGRETKLYSKDRLGMLVDWDTKTTWSATTALNSAWGISEDATKIVSSWPGVAPLAGEFGLINMVIPNGWGWANAKLVAMGNNDGSINGGKLYPFTPAGLYDPNANLSNFDMKFEMAVTKPVGDLVVQVWVPGEFTVTLNLKDFIKSSDGKWYTVSANLGNLAKSDGTKLAKYADVQSLSEGRVVIANPTAADIPQVMAIDNIRLMRVL
jgi:hypothetical protein